MFPNVRLMIVAVLASIMGISCALGLFAEFRVSHDSLLRESNAGSPLQLGASGPTANVIDTAASFEVRFQAQPGPQAVVAVVNNPAAGRAPATAGGPAAPGPQLAPVAAPPPATNAPQSPPDVAASPASPPPQEASNAASEPIPAAAASVSGRDGVPDNQKNSEPKADSKPAESVPANDAGQPADNKSADTKPAAPADNAAGQPADNKPDDTKPAAPADNAARQPVDNKPADTRPAAPADNAAGKPDDIKPADSKPADDANKTPVENKPADTLARRTPATSVTAREKAPARSKTESKIVPQRAPAALPRRHATARHRPLIARRVAPRARAVPAVEGFPAAQPFYQWTQQPPAAQPVPRRLIIRRSRSPRKPAQTAQPTVSGTAVVNAPE